MHLLHYLFYSALRNLKSREKCLLWARLGAFLFVIIIIRLVTVIITHVSCSTRRYWQVHGESLWFIYFCSIFYLSYVEEETKPDINIKSVISNQ